MAKGFCMMCNSEIEVKICCSGYKCVCMGQPIDVPVCSEECYDKWEAEIINNSEQFEKVKSFYGENYEPLKYFIDNKGWLKLTDAIPEFIMGIYRANKDSFESRVEDLSLTSKFKINTFIRPICKLD